METRVKNPAGASRRSGAHPARSPRLEDAQIEARRARVAIRDVDTQHHELDDHLPTISFRLHNVGHSPARGVTWDISWALEPRSRHDDPEYPYDSLRDDEEGRDRVIAANLEYGHRILDPQADYLFESGKWMDTGTAGAASGGEA